MRRLAPALIACLTVPVALVATATAAQASTISGDFYVDNGSGCSNAYTTTSAANPWCDFTNLQGQTLAAGSRILLRAGDTWNQELGQLDGTGTSGSPIQITSYGSGALPHIQRGDGAGDRGIWINNADYWQLSNLEVSDAGAGIVFWYSSNGHQGISLNNISVHNMTGVVGGSPAQTDLPGMYHSPGIFITGQVPVTANSYAVSGVTMNAVAGNLNRDDIDISGFNPGGDLGFLNTSLGSHTVQNVVISDSNLHNAYAGSNFDNLTHLRIVSTIFDSNIQAHQSVGTTQLFLWSDNDVTMANSILKNGPDTGSPDQTGSDLEAYDNAVRFHGNYIGGNAGAGIEVLGLSGRTGDANTNHDIADNVFDNNASIGPSTGGIWFANNSGDTMTGTVTDNLYYQPAGLTSNGSYFTLSGNESLAQSAMYSAGNQFSGTQGGNGWGYQSSTDGVSWSYLTYDSTNARWGTTSAGIGPFDLYPPSSSSGWVARTWTAPAAGTVDLRGFAVKNQLGGSGVNVKILLNSITVFGPTTLGGSDQDGFATEASSLSVAAGDIVRFAVSPVSGNTNGLTSWAPNIGFTSSSASPSVIEDGTTGTGVNQVNYASGTWGSNTDVHYNTSTSGSDYYTVKFTGQQVVVHAGFNANHGIAGYAICDANGANCGTETPVDTYAASSILDQIVYTSPLLATGTHTLKVRNTGTKQAASSGNYIDVDKVVVSTAPSVIDDSTTGTGVNQLNYASGTWGNNTNVHYNTSTGGTAFYTVKFSGQQVVVHAGYNSDHAVAGYAICDANGANCGTETPVDTYAASSILDQIVYTSPLLATGTHTLKVRNTGTHNASSTDYYIDVDKVIVN